MNFGTDVNIGTLRNVEGDATTPQTTHAKEIALIPHCCNNGVNGNGIGVMGAGVALALRKKWPQVYTEYKIMENRDRGGLTNRLGDNSYAKIGNHLVVVNMIAQNGIASESNSIPLKYEALISCMRNIVDYVRMIQKQTSNPVVIHCPKFGSDLAGGDWNFIMELIKEIWLENGIDVVVYEWVG
jgi:hypothetical protein